MRRWLYLTIRDKKGEVVDSIRTTKTKRFLWHLQADKFVDCVFELKVRYSDHYYNDGIYKTKEKLIQAFKAFVEK